MTASLRLRRTTRFGVVLALLVLFGTLLASSGSAAAKAATDETPWSWPGAVMLSVDTTPSGDAAGNVRSDPYLIDCPGACTRPYDPGTKVTLTEAPTRGFTFTAWSGATCDEGQTSSTCTFVITQDTHVVADYSGKYDPHVPDATCCTLSVNVTGFQAYIGSTPGSAIDCVTPWYVWWIHAYFDPTFQNRCSASFNPGTEVTLFTGSGCDQFIGWSDTGSTSWTRTFKMTSNISVGAKYDGCP